MFLFSLALSFIKSRSDWENWLLKNVLRTVPSKDKPNLSKDCRYHSNRNPTRKKALDCESQIKRTVWTWKEVEKFRGRICRPFKEPRNRFPACRTCSTTLFVVPACQAGGIVPSESISGLHKRLQIRAQGSSKTWPELARGPRAGHVPLLLFLK